ncbi:type II toxin-antitoxin system VapC family toxin [Paraliomyxa miuraensis]|uniref:type II toxin-antitoxin system VapC family toxin n=1 Tax=Paraliomyxa miuraensis TaxID=376150 RepID=UPI00225AF703|nr:type II toxin-antitoxin system VapC family toxin [Paraliomyxa miuraensis]MCX4240040.1 type II toxin-antitoxin system VapC family toxin [Paraliomyxa miuraensis]
MIVLDTHAWLWLVSEPGRLGRNAAEAIDRADRIGVCAISCWELAMLVKHGRVVLDRPAPDWIRHSLAGPSMRLLPLEPEIAVRAASLPFYGDPADRLIVATALAHDALLVTKDDAIHESGLVRAVW